jgi:hypothetical protein
MKRGEPPGEGLSGNYSAPRIANGVVSIGESRAFSGEVLRLAGLAPEPRRSQLYAIAQTGKLAA